MKLITLKDAIVEANRFIIAAEKLRDHHMKYGDNALYVNSNPRASGAVRRASMDLTRKLADFRQGR